MMPEVVPVHLELRVVVHVDHFVDNGVLHVALAEVATLA